MEIATFIFYLLACCYLISTISFLRKSGLALRQLLSLFFLKVLAGFAYAKFYSLPKYFSGSDTWKFYQLSLKETIWLKSDPIAFITDIFVYGYSKPGNIFSGHNSYWNDLKSNLIIKLLACMNVITFDSYYTNIILFNFLFLFGLAALFKNLHIVYPNKKNILIACIFLLPSTLFWCSGIHKDGLILSATGMVIYLFYNGLHTFFSAKKIIGILLCLVLIFSLRNYVALAILPALFCWWWSNKKPSKSFAIFSVVYIVGIAAFFISPVIIPSINFPLFLANKQNEFLLLNGASVVTSTHLQPGLSSFISYLPVAMDMAFFRPHFSEAKNFSYIPAALEVLLFFFIILLAIFFNDRKPLKPITLFFIFFSLSILIIAGYTITFSGAIVRYRSFVLPLLLSPLVCMIDLKPIKNKFLFFQRKH